LVFCVTVFSLRSSGSQSKFLTRPPWASLYDAAPLNMIVLSTGVGTNNVKYVLSQVISDVFRNKSSQVRFVTNNVKYILSQIVSNTFHHEFSNAFCYRSSQIHLVTDHLKCVLLQIIWNSFVTTNLRYVLCTSLQDLELIDFCVTSVKSLDVPSNKKSVSNLRNWQSVFVHFVLPITSEIYCLWMKEMHGGNGMK
jgi:hypothetical protein